MLRGKKRLDLQHQTVSPRTEVIAVLGVQRRGAIAVDQISVQVLLAVDSPLGV
jgi:hypothetical protein